MVDNTETKNTTIILDVVNYSAKMNSDLGRNSKENTKKKYNIDKETCSRLNWGGELSKLGNKLDAVSSLSFDNYGLGFYFMENENYKEMSNSFEAAPTPEFHWLNFWMALSHHYLGNFDKANDYFSITKPLYGDNSIDTLNEGITMWNFKKIYDEELTKNFN